MTRPQNIFLRMFCSFVIIIKKFNFINSRRPWPPNFISSYKYKCNSHYVLYVNIKFWYCMTSTSAGEMISNTLLIVTYLYRLATIVTVTNATSIQGLYACTYTVAVTIQVIPKSTQLAMHAKSLNFKDTKTILLVAILQLAT